MSLFGYTQSQDSPAPVPAMLTRTDDTKRERTVLRAVVRHGRTSYYWCDPISGQQYWAHNPLRHPLDIPSLPPPIPCPPLDLPWKPRKRRHIPTSQRAPWVNPGGIQHAGPAFVAGQVASSSAATGTITVTLPSNVTTGNCIVLDVASLSTASFTLPTDTLSNLYVVAAAQSNTGNCKLATYFANNSPGGACTISFVVPSAATTITVREYSGVGSVAGNRTIVDSTSGNIASGATPSATVTPQQSGSLLLGAVCDATGGLTWTAGGALTTRRSSVTATMDLAVADAVLSSTSVGNATASWTNGGTTTQYIAVAIVLRPAGTQAVTVVKAQTFTSASSFTTSAYTPKPGTVNLAIVATASASVIASAVGDSATSPSNTWALIPNSRANNASGGETSLWLCNGVANAASQTLTATLTGGSTTGQIIILELSGVIPNASLVDVVLTAVGNGTAVSIGPSAATVIPGETALLIVGTPGAFTTTSTQGGSASLVTNSQSGNSSILAASLVLNATGTQTMTATLGTSSRWSAILITLNTGGVSLVQSVSATAATGNLTPTLPFNTAPGNLLCAKAQVNNQTGLSSVTGTNTWTRAKTTPNASGGTLDTWYAKNITGGKVQPTFAPGAVKSGVLLYELSGLDATAPFDIAANSTGNGQSPSVVTGIPNNLSSVVFGGVGDVAAGKSITVTSPAAAPQAVITTNVDLAAGFYTVFSPGAVPSAQTFGASIPTSASQYSVDAVLFKIAGSPTVEYLAATITGTSAVSGALTVTRALTATVTGTSAVSGSLTVTHRLVATVAGSSSLTGALTVTHRLSATVSGASALAGNLTVTHLLTASSTGVSTLTSSLRVTHQLVATVSGVSALTGAVTVTRLLHGAILGTSVVSGALTVRYETLPVVTSVAFALNAATTSPHPRNSATSRPFALNTAVTGVDV